MTAGLRHLRAFLAIAEEGSVTRAAAVLRLSQPTLSRRLRRLEDHLGVRLVDRSTHHLELTPEGRAFRDRAAAAVAAVDETLDPARAANRPLRLGHAWSALGRWTTPLLRRWREEHPLTPLELLRVDDRTAGLLRGEVDAAVVRGPLPEDAEGLRSEWLLDEPRVAAVPAGSALATRPEPLTLADLSGQPVVLNTVAGLTTLELWPQDIRPDEAAAVRVRNTDDWLGVIAGGSAVGTSTTATAELHPHPGVVYRPLAGTDDVPVRLVWPGTAAHPAVPALTALVLDILCVPPQGTE
ncbi:LysR family transcriptional regulator [Streptomyces armeniacus]|uniref:LysR family transcriptional regulator n=1 Tax=Streptomyces armeniacus TaxID=83291 RepID=A0A345XIM4_9ACTN|nr:LysR family transcriptional regulator [Streptomyces armeniacus]AXK31490.1 LysR family transcriptional regulator [Streptomyces armeniacus]